MIETPAAVQLVRIDMAVLHIFFPTAPCVKAAVSGLGFRNRFCLPALVTCGIERSAHLWEGPKIAMLGRGDSGEWRTGCPSSGPGGQVGPETALPLPPSVVNHVSSRENRKTR